ncbi:MAG: NfeD family protein [Lachnospiraceae bacterium]|nr:NfeD family protein [Lachnospiraceae bacterium]
MSPWFWLAITIVCILVELCTLALTSIWFAFGGFAAMIASFCADSIVVECVAFVVVAAAFLFLVRPSVVKRFNQRRIPTNVDTVIGQLGKVTVAVNNEDGTGRVSLGGMEWAARAANGYGPIPAGEMVLITKVEGVKVIVVPKEG